MLMLITKTTIYGDIFSTSLIIYFPFFLEIHCKHYLLLRFHHIHNEFIWTAKEFIWTALTAVNPSILVD